QDGGTQARAVGRGKVGMLPGVAFGEVGEGTLAGEVQKIVEQDERTWRQFATQRADRVRCIDIAHAELDESRNVRPIVDLVRGQSVRCAVPCKEVEFIRLDIVIRQAQNAGRTEARLHYHRLGKYLRRQRVEPSPSNHGNVCTFHSVDPFQLFAS